MTTSILILICTLTLYFLARLYLESDKLVQLIQDIRYFWGFIFFYIFFLSERLHNPLSENNYHAFFKIVVNVLIVLLFIEFLTSNLFSFQWPNRQHDFLEEIRENDIARAYGFGGNATVTSVLIISLTTLLYQGYIRDFLTLFLSVSATGLVTSLFKFILKQRRLTTLILAPPIVILLLHLLGFVANATDYPGLHRLSINYFLYIAELKLNQIHSVIDQIGFFELYVGQSLRDSDLRSDSFQLLDFFVFNGLIGTILFLLFVLTRTNKKNYISIILLLIGTIHYQVIFSLSGQIIFAWILSLTKSDHLATVTTNK